MWIFFLPSASNIHANSWYQINRTGKKRLQKSIISGFAIFFIFAVKFRVSPSLWIHTDFLKIETWLTYKKLCPSWIQLSGFKHIHKVVPPSSHFQNIFISPQRNLIPSNSHCPLSFSQLLVTTNSFSVFYGFPHSGHFI